MLVLASAHQGQMNLLSHRHRWFQGLTQIIDVEHLGALQPRHLGEIFVRREQPCSQQPRSLDETRIHSIGLRALRRLMDRNPDVAVLLHILQAVEPALPSLPLAL